MKQNLLNKLWLRVWMIVAVMTTALAGTAWADATTGTITFGKNDVAINSQNVTAADNQGNSWTITTTGTSSFTSNTAYYQIGSSKAPASSITFTTTLPDEVNVTAVEAKFGGFTGTEGTVTLKVGDTTVGTGSLNATTDVTVSSTSEEVGNVITVTITDIAKGVKAYYISYTYEAASPASPLASIALSGTYPTSFHQNDVFSHEGMTVTATYADESTKDVTAKAEFTGYDMSETGDQTVTVSYTENEVTKTAEYGITVNAPATLTSISLSGDYQTNFNEGEEFNHEGLVVTANYSDDTAVDVTSEAEFSTPNMDEVGTQTITVTYNEVSTTYDITINAIPTHNVTWSVNGETSSESYKEGAAITFPDDPADVSGKTFVGWVTEAIEGTADEAPEFVTSAIMGQSDVTYYAVFAYANGSGSAEVVDVLTRDWTGSTGTSYSNWSGKTSNSDAVYAGNSAGGNESIQLRSTSPSGIITTVSGGKVKDITVKWHAGTTEGRTLKIYGSNKAYSETSEVYNNATMGTELGSIVKGTNTKLEIEGEYEYIGIRSQSGALYLSEVQITWSTGGGVTYSGYCTTVVAAAVARPTIEVAENPFLFSTTATITCETEGATIKYSFDGETWNDYTDALTITATTTLYAKAVKDENESEVASVTITKNLAVPTVAIDATGITNTNVYDGTEAGSLAASVTYNDAAVEGATVTWSGNNDEVATIDENGAVTLVAAGTVTFTATYAGNDDFAEKTATYEMTVTNSDPNAPGSENNPYTVADAIDATPASGTSTNVYIHGIVSAFYGDDIVSDGSNYRYYVSDDGTTDNQLLVYRGKGLNNVTFSAADDLQIGDEVVILGGLTLYKGTPEVAANNYIVSLVRVEKPAAPTFSVAEGTYTEAQSVELSTTTEGATIYYTVDGTKPTAESTEYTEAIVVTETTTIKAIAVKDDVASEVATATYTINTTPSIELGDNEINAFAEGTDGVIIVTYNNITEVESEVFFCDAEGNAATYDWVAASINSIGNLEYIIDANTSTEARTAYMKVYALDDNAEDVYSELITINQAGFVVDFATLPFAWNSGTKDELTAETGVTAYGLGSDYAASNAPYRVKLDGTGDYIQVKTDCQPVIVSVDVKMLGGGNTSTITVQESADGETFTDVEELSISGSQNTVLYLQTANAFDAATRYVRLYFTKGSNVGLGGIAIEKDLDAVTVGTVGYATYVTKHNVSFPSDVEAYITSEVNTEKGYVSMTQVTAVPKGTPVVLKNEGTFTLAPATNLDNVSANELKASDTDIEADGTQYVLAKPTDQKIGFYKATGTIAAGKAYLQIAGEAPVKGFTFKFDDDATAIDEIVNGKLSNGKCYNLAGQRISKMQRGINIVNGKKILK